MHIRTLMVLIILGLTSLTATADFRTVMEVYEVELVYLRLPGSANGTLAFTECAECDTRTIRVTSATHYIVNGQGVELKDFRKAVIGVRNRHDTIVDVFHDLGSDTVTKVRVKL